MKSGMRETLLQEWEHTEKLIRNEFIKHFFGRVVVKSSGRWEPCCSNVQLKSQLNLCVLNFVLL